MIPVKNKIGGIVTGTVYGVAMLVVGVVIALVLISTIGDAGLLVGDDVKTITVTNESSIYINTTGYTLSGYNSSWNSISITNIINASNGTALVVNTDYTLTSGVLYNGSNAKTYTNVNASYTYGYDFVTDEEATITSMRYNVTDGIDEVSAKIPTILLIVAVVFLFGALILLIAQARRMGIGSSGSGGL